MIYLHLLKLLAPEAILVVTAILVLGLGLSGSSDRLRPLMTRLTLLGGLIAAWVLFIYPEDACVLNGMVVLDPLGRIFKLAILVLSMITVILSAASPVRRHFAEYLALILFATVGMLLLAGTEELLMIFIALELTSISLYVLTAYLKESSASAEAGLKYFLIGGVSAAFLLFGLSLVYGVEGTTNLRALLAISPAQATDPLMLAGIVLTLAGFGFKVAAVPFHLWAPDVYEGAPTPTAALVASGSKVAGFFILAKMLAIGFGASAGMAAWSQFRPGWLPLLAVMAALSIVLGNLAALAQSNVKRLLAYSAIAHSGYMLLGLTSATEAGFTAVFFYVIVYALTTIGAFGVVEVVERRRGGSQLQDFDGLYKAAPVLAICMLVFLISLAGIPPLAGFFGKFYMFAETLAASGEGSNPGMLWLVGLAIAMNAVSLYYYLIVLKHVFVAKPVDDEPCKSAACTPVIVVLALVILLLGLFPDALLEPLRAAVSFYTASLNLP